MWRYLVWSGQKEISSLIEAGENVLTAQLLLLEVCVLFWVWYLGAISSSWATECVTRNHVAENRWVEHLLPISVFHVSVYALLLQTVD